MNDDTQTNGPIMNGDDELAKTLTNGLKFEETPPALGDDQPSASDQTTAQDSTPPTMDDLVSSDDSGNDNSNSAAAPEPTNDSNDPPTTDSTADSSSPTSGSSNLDQLKSSALDDLKPLVGKLNLSPEEKFDTLLLIIRSTDDQSLLEQAHAAAKEITDDAKRAQALLDIIKEVDYFNSKK